MTPFDVLLIALAGLSCFSAGLVVACVFLNRSRGGVRLPQPGAEQDNLFLTHENPLSPGRCIPAHVMAGRFTWPFRLAVSPALEAQREAFRVNQCVRPPLHTGPCNGWPRVGCIRPTD